MSEEKNPVGRPATGVKRVTISISCQPEDAELLKSMAKKRNKIVSKYILDLVKQDSQE